MYPYGETFTQFAIKMGAVVIMLGLQIVLLVRSYRKKKEPKG